MGVDLGIFAINLNFIAWVARFPTKFSFASELAHPACPWTAACPKFSSEAARASSRHSLAYSPGLCGIISWAVPTYPRTGTSFHLGARPRICSMSSVYIHVCAAIINSTYQCRYRSARVRSRCGTRFIRLTVRSDPSVLSRWSCPLSELSPRSQS